MKAKPKNVFIAAISLFFVVVSFVVIGLGAIRSRKIETKVAAERKRPNRFRLTRLRSADAKQETIIAQQQKAIEALTTSLKEQAAQIKGVADQLRTQKPGPRLVAND